MFSHLDSNHVSEKQSERKPPRTIVSNSKKTSKQRSSSKPKPMPKSKPTRMPKEDSSSSGTAIPEILFIKVESASQDDREEVSMHNNPVENPVNIVHESVDGVKNETDEVWFIFFIRWSVLSTAIVETVGGTKIQNFLLNYLMYIFTSYTKVR